MLPPHSSSFANNKGGAGGGGGSGGNGSGSGRTEAEILERAEAAGVELRVHAWQQSTTAANDVWTAWKEMGGAAELEA